MSELSKLCQRLGIRCTAVNDCVAPDGWPAGTIGWTVVLKFQRRQLTTRFYQGPAVCREPAAADVLSCLASDASAGMQDFESFCSDFGYDSDSRRALATFEACRAMAPRLEKFLGDAFDAVTRAKH